jgi:hypothetical protein
MAARVDWLIRNHDGIKDRAEGIKSAIKTWVEAREKEAVTQGLSPPTI